MVGGDESVCVMIGYRKICFGKDRKEGFYKDVDIILVLFRDHDHFGILEVVENLKESFAQRIVLALRE